MKGLPISQAISPLKVAGEEHRATAALIRRPAEAKKAYFDSPATFKTRFSK